MKSKKKRNAQDITVLNLRAMKKRLDRLSMRLDAVAVRGICNERLIEEIEERLTELEKRK